MMEKAARHIVPSSSKHAIWAGPAATARTPRKEVRADGAAPVPYRFQRSATSRNLQQHKIKVDQTVQSWRYAVPRTEHSPNIQNIIKHS